MDMPINIVPAPFGAFVALYVHTGNEEAAEKFGVSFQKAADPLVYELRPIVAWCYCIDSDHALTNLPMTLDEYGRQAVVGFDPNEKLPGPLTWMQYAAERSRFDSVCTALEAEARVKEIAKFLGVEPERWGYGAFGGFGGEWGVTDLAPDFRV